MHEGNGVLVLRAVSTSHPGRQRLHLVHCLWVGISMKCKRNGRGKGGKGGKATVYSRSSAPGQE